MKILIKTLPFLLLILFSTCKNVPKIDAEKEDGSQLPTSKNNQNESTTSKVSAESDSKDGDNFSEEELNEFILDDHEILDFKRGDLNNDGTQDVVLILKAKNELETSDIDRPTLRPMLLLTRQADQTLKLIRRNDSSVLCVNCGGVLGDPYSGITIKSNYFSIEHMGGSSDRWSKIVTYKFDENKKNWFLHKDGGESYSTIDPDQKRTLSVKSTKDFGELSLESYNIYKPFSNSKTIAVGSSIQEVQAANGKPFLLLGFEIDRSIAGLVASWEGGKLEGQKVQFEYTKDIGSDVQNIMGDQPISSDNSFFTKAGTIVLEIK